MYNFNQLNYSNKCSLSNCQLFSTASASVFTFSDAFICRVFTSNRCPKVGKNSVISLGVSSTDKNSKEQTFTVEYFFVRLDATALFAKVKLALGALWIGTLKAEIKGSLGALSCWDALLDDIADS